MKIGVCRNVVQSIEDYPVQTAHVEISAMDLRNMDPAIYNTFKKKVEAGEILTYSCNGLFPGDIRLTGDVDKVVLKDYCDKTFYKLAELGIKLAVFGSGKAKHVPDGFDRQKAWEQLYELGTLLSDEAKQYGQTVVVEPLRFEEVNIVNTVVEGAEYCRVVGRDNFKLLVDFYHFNSNGEDWATLEQNKDLLCHTHIATPVKRSRPQTEEEWAFFARCMSALKNIGYTGRMSFEGGFHSAADFDAMLLRMREIDASL